MSAIFISYRRDDTEGHAGRLFEALVKHFGKGSVFMDVATIEPGRDFRKVIDSNVASSSAVLTLIGKNWLDAKDEQGRRRIDSAADFVRIETISALKRDIPVIPVLVHNATMPRADQLPPELEELAYRNGVELTHARWDSDVQVLIAALERCMATTPSTAAASAAPKAATPGVPLTATPSPPAPAVTPSRPPAGPAPANDRVRTIPAALKLAALLLLVAGLGWGSVTIYQSWADEQMRLAEIAARQAESVRQAKAEADAAQAKAADDRAAAASQAEQARRAAEQARRDEAARREAAQREKEQADLAASRMVEAERQAAAKGQALATRETELRAREDAIQRQAAALKQAETDKATREAAQRAEEQRARDAEASRRAAMPKKTDADTRCVALLRQQQGRHAADPTGARYRAYFTYVRGTGANAEAVARTMSDLLGVEIRNSPSPGEDAPGCIGYRSDIFGSREGAECIAAALGAGYAARDEGCSGSGFPYTIIPRQAAKSAGTATPGAMTVSIELERQCFAAVQGKVAWNQQGSVVWQDANVKDLCRGTRNPGATIACFQAEIRTHNQWQRAVAACH